MPTNTPPPARLALSLICLAAAASAAIQPSLLFSDNMVLVSSATLNANIFGTAAPFEHVALDDSRPGSTRRLATADASGRWLISLAPHVREKGESSFTLTLSGGGEGGGPSHVATNVAYGDVLLCSGQSNMELPLSSVYNWTDTIKPASNRPEIRLFYVHQEGSDTPRQHLLGSPSWQPSTPAAAVGFSAVCYLTALELQRLHHDGDDDAVYGLIESAVGSTDVQSWMAKEARATALNTCWTPSNATVLPPSGSHAPGNWTVASQLWNAMIAPLTSFGVSVVLWDQGENNAKYCTESEYNCLFTSMVAHWRQQFRQPRLPFAWVQIGGYASDPYDQGGARQNSVIRFAQGDSLPALSDQNFNNRSSTTAAAAGSPAAAVPRYALPAPAAMTQTFDLGSPVLGKEDNCRAHPGEAVCWWIHCRNKTEVARRLAHQLAHVWTASGGAPIANATEWSGPVVTQTTLKIALGQPFAVVSFGHAKGLVLRGAQRCFHCCNQTSPPLGQVGHGEYLFEVANRRGVWLPAVGELLDPALGTVKVTPTSPVPCAAPASCWLTAVRYAVLDVPQCALYNEAEFPAGQFELPVPWTAPASSTY